MMAEAFLSRRLCGSLMFGWLWGSPCLTLSSTFVSLVQCVVTRSTLRDPDAVHFMLNQTLSGLTLSEQNSLRICTLFFSVDPKTSPAMAAPTATDYDPGVEAWSRRPGQQRASVPDGVIHSLMVLNFAASGGRHARAGFRQGLAWNAILLVHS